MCPKIVLDKLSKLDSKVSDIWNYFRTMSDGRRQTESLINIDFTRSVVDCGPRFAILYWTVYYQCKIPVSGKSEPIILKKLDLFSWKFHEIHTQRSLVMRAQKLLYVFARRYQMISACMTVSVRELRTAVREWACCVPTNNHAHSRFRICTVHSESTYARIML